MKPVKRSVAVIVRRPAGQAGGGAPGEGAFLIVRRPDDPGDPLAGVWGLPAITLLDGEDERAAVVRAGRVKLGVRLAPGARVGEKTADRGGYLLRLADYEALILAGAPAVPQPARSVTQYTECRYTTDPGTLQEAAARGSLCAQVFLEDRARAAGRAPAPRPRSLPGPVPDNVTATPAPGGAGPDRGPGAGTAPLPAPGTAAAAWRGTSRHGRR